MVSQLERLLEESGSLVLDGATGTELERRGFPLCTPGWSAAAIEQAPELLRQIHEDYVTAGAKLITANTFRTHARSLSQTPWANRAREMTQSAVRIARQAAGKKALVAGGIAPLADCYSPELTPARLDLIGEHRELIRHLAEAEVDVLLIETQLTICESTIIAELAAETAIPFLISFVIGRNGQLLSGEPLGEALRAMKQFAPLGCMLNCLPADEVEVAQSCLDEDVKGRLIGVYANTGRLRRDGTWESTASRNPAVYADFAARWNELGLRLIGGCCGTTPEHITLVTKMVYDSRR